MGNSEATSHTIGKDIFFQNCISLKVRSGSDENKLI